MWAVAEPTNGCARLLRSDDVRLLSASSDDDYLDTRRPCRTAHGINHQINAVPSGEAAEKHDKRPGGGRCKWVEQRRVGSVRNDRYWTLYAFLPQPARQLARYRQNMIAAMPLRPVEPCDEAGARFEPRIGNNDIDVWTIDLLKDHEPMPARGESDRPGEKMCPNIDGIVLAERQQRPHCNAQVRQRAPDQ